MHRFHCQPHVPGARLDGEPGRSAPLGHEALVLQTGAIVHDLNDLLMNVLGGLDIASDQLVGPDRTSDPGDVLATIDAIREATARGQTVVGQLLALARSG